MQRAAPNGEPTNLGMKGEEVWSPGKVLVCLAVKEEARAFRRLASARPGWRILLTGIGQRNAQESVRVALTAETPDLVLSCGFAGGLRPDLTTGTVVFAAAPETGLAPALRDAGAVPGTFHCSDRVVSRADEKRALHARTGADAVEMESEIICRICRDRELPSAVVRVILDPAGQDLPLNFNELMTPDQRLHARKMAVELLTSPGKVPALLSLRRQARAAAERLAQVLLRFLESKRL